MRHYHRYLDFWLSKQNYQVIICFYVEYKYYYHSVNNIVIFCFTTKAFAAQSQPLSVQIPDLAKREKVNSLHSFLHQIKGPVTQEGRDCILKVWLLCLYLNCETHTNIIYFKKNEQKWFTIKMENYVLVRFFFKGLHFLDAQNILLFHICIICSNLKITQGKDSSLRRILMQ